MGIIGTDRMNHWIGITLLAGLLFTGPDCQGRPDQREISMLNGRLAYQQYCLKCHGPLGRGNGTRMANPPVPDLVSPSIKEKLGNGKAVRVHEGRNGGPMGTLRLPLSDREADEVLEYVLSLQSVGLGLP